jgi:hypothetical protein
MRMTRRATSRPPLRERTPPPLARAQSPPRTAPTTLAQALKVLDIRALELSALRAQAWQRGNGVSATLAQASATLRLKLTAVLLQANSPQTRAAGKYADAGRPARQSGARGAAAAAAAVAAADSSATVARILGGTATLTADAARKKLEILADIGLGLQLATLRAHGTAYVITTHRGNRLPGPMPAVRAVAPGAAVEVATRMSLTTAKVLMKFGDGLLALAVTNGGLEAVIRQLLRLKNPAKQVMGNVGLLVPLLFASSPKNT